MHKRQVLGLVVGFVVICALAAVARIALRKPTAPSTPVIVQARATAMPGDAYIDQSARTYVETVIAGDPQAIQRLRQTTIDADAVRQETLGRFVSRSASSLKVTGVHDEVALSGNGPNQPATGWTAAVTVAATKTSQVETFGVDVRGSYGTNGSIDSASADSSAR